MPTARRPRRTRNAERAERAQLAEIGLVSGLVGDLLAGRATELLSPLRFLAPGKSPTGRPPKVDRAPIARGLAISNLSYGHPRAGELAEKLADPATRVVITGQQTGLLGGPLLALVKAAAAVRWAETLEAAGKPAIALFWMATEDHDWDEIAAATFATADGPRRFGLGDDPQPLAPVGLRTVGMGVVSILRELGEIFPDQGYHTWVARLMAIWRPEARFGEAFAKQLVDTFGHRAPLVVDSLAPALKRASAPAFLQLVERRAEVDAAYAAADERMRAAGYPLRVAPQPGASPLFLLRSHERRRIEWRGADRFALRGLPGDEPVEALLATIADNPAIVSPGVLARPAIQDALFGTTLQVMGPGELAYLAQAAPIYELLGVEPPWTTLRPMAVVVEAKQLRRMSELGLEPAELVADPAAAERRLGERSGGDFVAAPRDEIAQLVERLRAPALALDASLERPFEKTRDSVLHSLDLFATKAAAAAARRDEVTRRRFAALVEICRPEGVPQERLISSAHFVGAYGPGFGAALLDQLDLDPRRLSVIEPDRQPPPRAAAETASEESSDPQEGAAGAPA